MGGFVLMASVLSIFRQRLESACVRMGIARLRRDDSGATAVEFGLLAAPFVALLFAVIETGLIFFGEQTLETATVNAARLIRTGQAQQQGLSADAFKSVICSKVMPVIDCESGLKVEVKKYATFADIDLSKPVDGSGNLKTAFDYQPGKGGEIITVRAFYEWPTLASLLGLNLSNMPNGKHLIVGVTAFRNEPFPW